MKFPLAILVGAAGLAACQPVPMEPEDGGATPSGSETVAAQLPQETPMPSPAPSPAPTRTGPYVATAPLPPPSAASSPVTGTAQSELVGEYRVAGVDGGEVDLGHAITLTITPTTIEFVSQCVRGVWRYRREGDRLATQPVPVAMCRRALFPQEEALSAVFAAGPVFRRTRANGISFSGGGHTVTLFSQ